MNNGENERRRYVAPHAEYGVYTPYFNLLSNGSLFLRPPSLQDIEDYLELKELEDEGEL